ncbi:hypothetical protein HHL27_04190 [Novosphingobium sp. TW-4]|uniref:Alpha/beta hydrolase n=2 Tax=Novosphingobium olei TaxID=2728851 RepID=A0A7Y0BM28_9SPHN|nr:hypothetical protein [Novosphingobium olei]
MIWAFRRIAAQFLLCSICAAPFAAYATPLTLARIEHSGTINEIPSGSRTKTIGHSIPANVSYQNRITGSPAQTDGKGSVSGSKEPVKFGPFVVLGETQAILTRETDTDSPREFADMLKRFPGITTLELSDCPGTLDDNANLQLAHMIHDRGISTDVPRGGSVRSGAVDLFLAGLHRTTAPDAKFAIHAWIDEDGQRPSNFPADDPINRRYVQFYHNTAGMTEAVAVRFYDLANSVPFENALWLTPYQLARFVDIKIESQDEVDTIEGLDQK